MLERRYAIPTACQLCCETNESNKKSRNRLVAGWRVVTSGLFHQQHLARALDGAIQPALIVGRQSGIFSRQNATVVRDKLPQQVRVLEIEGVDREINLRLWPRCAFLHGPAASPSAGAVSFIRVSLAWHKSG